MKLDGTDIDYYLGWGGGEQWPLKYQNCNCDSAAVI